MSEAAARTRTQAREGEEEVALQRTLTERRSLEGVGLHSGEEVRAELTPADPDTGIVFRRMDLPGRPAVAARVENVTKAEWGTVLGGEAGVATVEHVLAALSALSVDNVEVRVHGPEPPALDGSAAPWCEVIRDAGIRDQDRPARILRLQAPVHLTVGESSYTAVPHPFRRYSAEIEFAHPVIGRQSASITLEDGRFCREVAPARTFGLEIWKDGLREQGLALGASLDNTIVVTDDGLAADTDLRFPDEFARHKLLDLVGDMALLGGRLHAHVVARRPGHTGNVALARRLAEELDSAERGSGPPLDISDILEYMPHRYPFLMVDRIVEFERGERIVGLKNVTINEPYFTGHFPGHPIMPGVLIVESMAQTGGLLLMNEFDDPENKVVYLVSLDDVKFRRPVTPGDSLRCELEMVHFRGRICRMKGIARVDGDVVAEASLMARVMDR